MIADKFSCFRRDFMGAPIRQAFQMMIAGKGKDFKACQIDYRPSER